jgi:prepilin-type N-terminal cleavage/methylation domain-containing protein
MVGSLGGGRSLTSHGETRLERHARNGSTKKSDEGFTLIELIVVSTIMPLIVGALGAGLLAIFSLQGSVSARLSHTSDSQVVSANYQHDIVGASQVTTESSNANECGPIAGATQLLGLESGIQGTGALAGVYPTIISYYSVPTTTGSITTYAMVRHACTNFSLTTTNSTTLAYNLPGTQSAPFVTTQPAPTVYCVADVLSSLCSDALAKTTFVPAKYISDIIFPITDSTGNDPYTLVASPVESTSTSDAGSAFTANTTTSCNFSSPGSGTYASTLCFVDFSSLTGPALTAARNGCLEMSVSIVGGYTMYFCLGLTGGPVAPASLPTYQQAFLGNSIGGEPFYTGVVGDPALYQTSAAKSSTSTITFSNISVVSPNGVLATGWEAVSADAESTDTGESITWSSNQAMTIIPNGQAGQIQPMGNACLDDGSLPNGASGLTMGPGDTTVTCAGTVTVAGTSYSVTGAQKTGAAMVWAPAPTTMSAVMVGGGLQAITFGLLLS